jgi:ubiquinone/menaquinone biosynthesis C-methylase UbiE
MNHREYFNQLAPKWDQMTSEQTKVRLASLVKELGIKPGDTILDIGSGTGILLPHLHKSTNGKSRVVSLDIAEEMLKRARSNGLQDNIGYVHGDASSLPLANEAFDMVICYSCFPHFRNKTKALREIARVLKEGGRLAICHTASRREINELHRSIGGVVKNDTIPLKTTMRKLLEASGLKPMEIQDEKHRYMVIAAKGR